MAVYRVISEMHNEIQIVKCCQECFQETRIWSNQSHFLSYYVISEADMVTEKKQLYNQVKYLPIYLIYQQTFQIVLNRNNAACISNFFEKNVFHCLTVGVLCWGWLSLKQTNKHPLIPRIPFPSMALGQDQDTGTYLTRSERGIP